MLRLLSDENFNNDIVRGLLFKQPDVDIVRIQDVGLGEGEDPEILAWAAENNRILLTHDQSTYPILPMRVWRLASPCPAYSSSTSGSR
jgi:predicted nuclease of predicted toxin-antitoxin system